MPDHTPDRRVEASAPAAPVGVISPWWFVVTFAAVAALAAVARLPEPVAAGVVLLVAGGATLAHPANGLAALVLCTPFLLGEPKTPYFLFEPLMAAVVLSGFLLHRLRGRVGFGPGPGGLTIAFLAAAVIALPLDLRDLLEDLWLLRSLDWSLMLVQGVPDVSHLKYLDRVVVVALGAALLAVTAQPVMGRAVVRTLAPLALVVGAVAGFGLLRFFGWVQTAGQYLTLSFWTWQNPDLRLTAVAWNPDYLALLLVLAVPALAAVAAGGAAPAWQRWLGGAAAGIGSLALVFTFQRAAYLALLLALVGLAALLVRVPGGRQAGAPVLVFGGLAGAVLAAAALDALVLHGRVAGRLSRLVEDPNRLRLWQTALRMALDHPLLGVGTGRYAFFFREYAGALGEGFGPFWGTAHSLYLHLLAEQGIVGLASFTALFGGIWLGALRRAPRLPPPTAVPLIGVLAGLAGWFAYGVVQFTFRVDALFHLACILAGTAVALAPPVPRPARSRRWVLAAVAIGLVLFGGRAVDALRRPVSPGYEAGFYRWERQPEGGAARWTQRRAAMTVPVGGRVMTLRFRAPIRDLAARPQTVRIWVDRRASGVARLSTLDWQTVEVPVGEPRGAHVLLELEAAYTFVPSRASASRDTRRLGVMLGEVGWRDE